MSDRKNVVLVDADNTLWDTDTVFQNAQLLLLDRLESATGRNTSAVERLGFVRSYDQALARTHHLHLRYPPQLLVRAIEAGLSDVPERLAAQKAISGGQPAVNPLSQAEVAAIVAEYLLALGHVPTLLPSVEEGVRTATEAGLELFVMTEGRIDRQRHFLKIHGLEPFFKGVWEITKERAQFDRIRVRFKERHVIVIGDQPDRDIAPAKAAGCTAVLVPSRFKPSWQVAIDDPVPDYVGTDFLDAIRWCLRASFMEPDQA